MFSVWLNEVFISAEYQNQWSIRVIMMFAFLKKIITLGKNSVKLTKKYSFCPPHGKILRFWSPCRFRKRFVYHVEKAKNSRLPHEIFQ